MIVLTQSCLIRPRMNWEISTLMGGGWAEQIRYEYSLYPSTDLRETDLNAYHIQSEFQ